MWRMMCLSRKRKRISHSLANAALPMARWRRKREWWGIMTKDENMKRAIRWTVALVLLTTAAPMASAQALLTVAETSGYKATSKHAEVIEYCARLAKLSPLVRVAELGVTTEGRKLPLVILADPPIATPEEAARSGKL